jgi:hypothetical protein
MGQFDDFIDLADELIAENGETSTLVRAVDGAPADANKPWRPGTAVVTSYQTPAVWLDEHLAAKAGFLIKEGQALVLIPAKDMPVKPDPATDTITRADGSKHAVVDCAPLDPNGQTIIYQVKVAN